MDTSFERKDNKDEWLTPPHILQALGDFDLDPCAPINRPWDMAKNHYTMFDSGLLKEWTGRVWCNPPYGKETAKWLERCAYHRNAIALTFARTETRMFFDHVWDKATALLFIKGRLRFWTVKGEQGGTAGAPSVLIAYNDENANILKSCSIKGKFISI